jgi:hypothetical protein
MRDHFSMDIGFTCPNFSRQENVKYSMNYQNYRNCSDSEQMGRKTDVNPKCDIQYTYARHGLCFAGSMMKLAKGISFISQHCHFSSQQEVNENVSTLVFGM